MFFLELYYCARTCRVFFVGTAKVLYQSGKENRKFSILAMCCVFQVVQFQNVRESQRLDADAIDIARGSSAEKWVCVGSKRTHTHDVRALAIATPIISTGTPCYLVFVFFWFFWC